MHDPGPFSGISVKMEIIAVHLLWDCVQTVIVPLKYYEADVEKSNNTMLLLVMNVYWIPGYVNNTYREFRSNF